jgi:predicted HTH transcriptional regulator
VDALIFSVREGQTAMRQTETHRVEYKQKLTDDLEKDVVAFLNSNGGTLYIGIRDDGTIAGVENPDQVQLKIKDRLISNIRPGIMGLFEILTEERKGKTIVVVKLAGGLEMPYYIKQKGRSEAGCFIRAGSSAQPMSEAMIESLMSKRHPASLINMPSRHQALTFRQLKIFYEGKGKSLNEHFARTLDFRTRDGEYNQLAFLFADENSVSIRVAKWRGVDKLDLLENEEYGYCSLVRAMQNVLDRFEIENITQARKRGLGPRLERKLADRIALREVIINAFVHNDYSRGDTPIFGIFSDRFEITSYGGLVEGLSREEFFDGVSRPRNREIMRVLKDLEYVEQLGSGMPRIVGRYGRDVFHFYTNILRASLKFDLVMDEEMTTENDDGETAVPETVQKTAPETVQKTVRKIMQAIRQNPAASARGLAVLSGLTPRGVKWHLEKLKARKLVRRVGPDRGGYWEVTGEVVEDEDKS